MAYTRIHAIKTTLNKALDYIENPAKTDQQLLVSGFNVDPLTASIEYHMTAALAKEMHGNYDNTGSANNLAYHMIQSFAPFDNITPEVAHELGRKWADEILEGKYEYVISTHVDKGHIHNHVIFNATSFDDYKKYETVPNKTAAHLRKTSDRLCEEKGLYVIKNPKFKGKRSRYEWQQRTGGVSWKAQIEKIIDKAILQSGTFEQFCEILKNNDVEVQNVTAEQGRHIKFRLSGQERFTRGHDEYTRERIIERIADPNKDKTPTVDRQPAEISSASSRQSVNSSFDKRVEWQARNTKLAATKELAAALLTIRQETINEYEDFTKKVDDLSKKHSGVRDTVEVLNDSNKEYKKTAALILVYNKYEPIYREYADLNGRKKENFAIRYQSELDMYKNAVGQIDKMNVNTETDTEKIYALIREHDAQVNSLNDNMADINTRINNLEIAKQIVAQVQGREYEPPENRSENIPEKKISMSERIKAAKSKADSINSKRAPEQKKEREAER